MKCIRVAGRQVLRSKRKIFRKKSNRVTEYVTLADDIDFIISDLLRLALKDPSIQIKHLA